MSIITDTVASTQQERDALAAWMRRTFLPVYAGLGNAADSGTSNQRDLLAYLFGVLAARGKDADLLAQARSVADRYLADPASVDPTFGQTALGIAAENGDSALFDKLEKIYETSSDPEMQEVALRELVTFKNPELLERALEYSVSSKVRNQDSAIQFNLAMRIPENRDQAWKFIKTHWDQVKTEFTPEMGSYFVAGTGNFCSVEARDDVKNFFASHPVPAADVARQARSRAHRRLHRIAQTAGAEPEAMAGRAGAISQIVANSWMPLQLAQTRAGLVQLRILLGEAEAQQIFAAAGAEECRSRYGGHAGRAQQMARLFRGGLAGQAFGVWP